MTILALHYWAGSGREYDLLPGPLLAPDLPGFGTQPVPPGFDYSVAAYADWVAAFIAAHQLAEYTLIGHGMGGKIALALAARRPAGLSRLVLLSPSPPTPEPSAAADRTAALRAYAQPAEAEKTFRRITARPLPAARHWQVVTDNPRTTRAARNA